MFAGLLSSKLVFLDAIGSDPTQPRKIPGARAKAACPCPWPWRLSTSPPLEACGPSACTCACSRQAVLPVLTAASVRAEPYSMHTGFNPSKSGYIQQVSVCLVSKPSCPCLFGGQRMVLAGWSVCLSVCPSVHLSVCPSVRLYLCACRCLSLSVCPCGLFCLCLCVSVSASVSVQCVKAMLLSL